MLRYFVFLWISFGFLYSLGNSEVCQGKNLPMMYEFVFKNVCFEFVGESKNWSQARSSCGERGGELLNTMNNPIKSFLKNITSKRNISNRTWWLGEGVPGKYEGPTESE